MLGGRHFTAVLGRGVCLDLPRGHPADTGRLRPEDGRQRPEAGRQRGDGDRGDAADDGLACALKGSRGVHVRLDERGVLKGISSSRPSAR